MKSVNSESTMELTQDAAEEMGMKPYYLYRQKNMTGNMENVGYAKPGKEGIYNILIMEEMQTIVALGAGASVQRQYIQTAGSKDAKMSRISRLIWKKQTR